MTAHFHTNRSILATYPETTVCQPPADWAADGVAFEHLACDVSGIKQALLADPTMEIRAKAMGKRLRIKSTRNVEWSFRGKLHGIGAETAEDSQVPATYLSDLLAWGFGAQHRTYTREVTSSANAYTLTVGNGLTTGFAVGCLVAVEDKTSPSAQWTGKPVLRQVATVDAVTHTITLTEALPFTPAAGDMIHATITIYVDEDILQDAVRSGSLYTRNFYHRRIMGSNTDTIYQLEGTVASVAFANLARGQLPEIAFSCMSANFRHSGTDSLAAATFSSVEGEPQLSNGVDLVAWISDASGTTATMVDVREAAFEPGITRTREEATTEVLDRFEGMSTYSATFGECKFTTTLAGYLPAWYASLADDDEFRITFTQPGPGTGAGRGWGFVVPRAQLAATPTLAAGGTTFGAALEFHAMIPTLGSTELATSPFVIGLF